MSVRISDKFGFLHIKFIRFFIDIAGVGLHIYHFSNKHIMRTQRNDFPDFTFDTNGRFSYYRCFNFFSCGGCKFHFPEFVVIFSAPYSAPIGSASQFFVGQIDNKLTRSFYYFIRMPFRTNRNVTHGWICTDSSHPTDGNNIVFFFRFATRNHHRRKRVNHGAGFPTHPNPL